MTGPLKKADLTALASKMATSGGRFDTAEMKAWTAKAKALTADHGRATPELQDTISEVEKSFSDKFTRGAKPVFQSFVAEVGAKMEGPIEMPSNDTPIWLKGVHPLANYQSNPKLPREADIVIVGTGLTGASAAYHISKAAEKRGLKVVVLDAADPGTGASGRNGGNFELIPENFYGSYGTYDGLEEERFKFLKASYPDVSDDALRAQAKRIAETVLSFGHKNANRMARTIEKEKIDCDYSPSGWLRTALNEREARAFEAEAKLAGKAGAKVEILSGPEIEARYKFPAKHAGRLVTANGNYHPFKLVNGELQKALDRGVELYTRTPVKRVRSLEDDVHMVETPKGTIRAKRVIVATNAFTSQIFPELADVKYFRSQISSYAHVENDLKGITVTAKDGDIYANFPKGEQYEDAAKRARGTLIVGGGQDVEDVDPWKAAPSREVFALSQSEIASHFPAAAQQPATAAWAGPMAFVEGKHGMRLPVLGPLGDGAKSGVFVAIWCNGYGGTGCHLAGAGAASWALTGRVPKEMPADVFGPARLFTDTPQFAVPAASEKK